MVHPVKMLRLQVLNGAMVGQHRSRVLLQEVLLKVAMVVNVAALEVEKVLGCMEVEEEEGSLEGVVDEEEEVAVVMLEKMEIMLLKKLAICTVEKSR